MARLQLCQSPRIETVQDRLQRSHPGDVGGALSGRVLAHGEGVEVDGAAVVVPAQRRQQLQCLPGVDAADQEAVVGLPVTVVEVDAEEAAFAQRQRGGQGGLLARHQAVTEVDLHAEVGQTDIVDSEESLPHAAHERRAPRFERLVLDADPDRRVVRGHAPETVDLVGPEPVVVDLERVVEAVVCHPEVDMWHTEPGRHFDGVLSQSDRPCLGLGARAGERAVSEVRPLEAKAQRRQCQPGLGQHLDQRALGRSLNMLRVVQLHRRHARNARNGTQQIRRGGIAIDAAVAKRVQAGGEAVAVRNDRHASSSAA